jgi:hypothetical protein
VPRDLGQAPVVKFGEHGDETLVSTKGGEFLDVSWDCQLSKTSNPFILILIIVTFPCEALINTETAYNYSKTGKIGHPCRSATCQG